MTRDEAHRRAIEAGASVMHTTSGTFKQRFEVGVNAYLAAMMLPIPQHPGDILPKLFIAFYENGHVTPCEFSECSVGGPDDHETFHPMIAPCDKKGRPLSDYEAPWPTHFTFLSEPPK